MSRVDPKCWLCGVFVSPQVGYKPLICGECLPGYRERKFTFVRASQWEIDELFGGGPFTGTTESSDTTKNEVVTPTT